MVDLRSKTFARLCVTIAVALVALCVCSAVFVRTQTTQDWFGDICTPLASAFGAVGAFFAYRRNKAVGNTALAHTWRLICIAVVFYAVGGALWFVLDVFLKISPFPSVADLFYFAYYPIFTYAILKLPKPQVSNTERSKLMLEMTIAMTAMALVFTSLVIFPLLARRSEIDLFKMTLTVAYPTADISLLWAIASLTITRNPFRKPSTGILLASGLLCMVLADLSFAYLTIQDAFLSGRWTDVLYSMGGALVGLSGFRAAATADEKPPGNSSSERGLHDEVLPSVDWRRQLPSTVLALILVLIAWLPSGFFHGRFAFLLIGSVIFVALVFVRQLLSLKENTELNQTLMRTWAGLELRERELQKTHEQLQLQIEERENLASEQRILEARIQQMQKLESLGVLAGGIAHDFNNLLTGILGNAALAQEVLPPEHPVIEYLADVEQAALRAAGLTNQMLAYSGRGAFTVRRVNLNRMIREMDSLLRASISKKVELELELDADLPQMDADANQLSQVLMNLITNASEAIEPAAGTIRVQTGIVEVDDTFFDQALLHDDLPCGEYVYLEITDDGTGMDAKTLDRAFEPFFTTKFTGRGLGLPATLGIIRGHKGNIQIHSEPGLGTRITLIFPPANGVGIPHRRKRTMDARSSDTKKTILIVDDENLVRNVAARLLKQRGFTTLEAQNGEQAIHTFEQRNEEIDVILLDLMMPIMGGEEAFKEIRRLNPNVPVVLASGFTETAVSARFPNEGPDGFLQKPFTGQQLTQALESVLEHKARQGRPGFGNPSEADQPAAT